MASHQLDTPTTLDDMLLYVLWQYQARAGSLVTRMCESEFGVTRREWRLLAHLAPNEGIVSSQLAERTGLDRARTSRVLTKLAQKNLVQRTPRPGDRRQVLVRLTEEGRRLHDALLPRVADINRALLAPLSTGEIHLLDSLLVSLQAQAERLAGCTDTGVPARYTTAR